MIHYNPDKHQEIIVNALKRCFDKGEVIDRPISPTPKHGKCYIIASNKTYCIDEDTLSHLEQEAHRRWKEDTRIRFAKELDVSLEHVEELVEYAYFNKALFLSDSMKVRASLFNPPCKDAETDLVAELPKIRPQGGTSCSHPERIPYYLRGRMQGTPANTDWRLYERMKKESLGLIPASRAPKAYIEYNPEEHHDMLVEYLVDAWIRHQPLDFPYLPHQFDGTPNFAINKDDTWYLFHGNKLWLELNSDASDRHNEIMSSEEALNSLRCRDMIGMKEMDILKMKDYDTL